MLDSRRRLSYKVEVQRLNKSVKTKLSGVLGMCRCAVCARRHVVPGARKDWE